MIHYGFHLGSHGQSTELQTTLNTASALVDGRQVLSAQVRVGLACLRPLGGGSAPYPPFYAFNPFPHYPPKPTLQILTSKPSNPSPHSKNHLNLPPPYRLNPYTLSSTSTPTPHTHLQKPSHKQQP